MNSSCFQATVRMSIREVVREPRTRLPLLMTMSVAASSMLCGSLAMALFGTDILTSRAHLNEVSRTTVDV